MKKVLFFLTVSLLMCVQVQAQMMNAALHIADHAIRVDPKSAQKVMKKESFKKLTRKGDIIYFESKKLSSDAMMILSGDYVDYLKFLFPNMPSPREVDAAVFHCGYRFVGGDGPDRRYRKGPLVLYTSRIYDNPNYVFGFVIKYEPEF